MREITRREALRLLAAGGGVLGLGLAAGCGRSGGGDMMGSGMMGGVSPAMTLIFDICPRAALADGETQLLFSHLLPSYSR